MILPINFIHEFRHSLSSNDDFNSLEQVAARATKLISARGSNENTMLQVDKDMQRDSISIDGVVYTSETGDYIVEALAQKILKVFTDTLGIRTEV